MRHEHLLVLLLQKRRAMGGGIRSDELINRRRRSALRSVGRWPPGREATKEGVRGEGEIGKAASKGAGWTAHVPRQWEQESPSRLLGRLRWWRRRGAGGEGGLSRRRRRRGGGGAAKGSSRVGTMEEGQYGCEYGGLVFGRQWQGSFGVSDYFAF